MADGGGTMWKRLQKLEAQVEALQTTGAATDAEMEGHGARLATLEEQQQRLDRRLSWIEPRVERRGRPTKRTRRKTKPKT